MFGQMNLVQFQGLKNMPQKAQSAWDAVFPTEDDSIEKKFVGAGYSFIAATNPSMARSTGLSPSKQSRTKFEIRHVIKPAILEKDGEYKLDDKSVTKIF